MIQEIKDHKTVPCEQCRKIEEALIAGYQNCRMLVMQGMRRGNWIQARRRLRGGDAREFRVVDLSVRPRCLDLKRAKLMAFKYLAQKCLLS